MIQFTQGKCCLALAASAFFSGLVPAQAGLTITPIYDNSVLSAPNAAHYVAGFNYAIQQFTSQFNNDVSLRMKVILGGSGGSSGSAFTTPYTYAELRTALAAHSVVAAAGLSPNDPISGDHIYSLTVANAVAIGLPVRMLDLGLTDGDPTLAGVITLEGNPSYRFNPGDPTPDVPVGVDFVGTAMHEIAEVMGRTQAQFPVELVPCDLFRFTAAGVRGLTPDEPGVYFSLNFGATKLKGFNQFANDGDLQDWDDADPMDAFNAVGTDGGSRMSAADIIVMQAIGYTLITTEPPPPTLNYIVSGKNLTLSWDRGASDYTLESKANFGTATWTTVGTLNPTTITTGSGNNFYRLRK